MKLAPELIFLLGCTFMCSAWAQAPGHENPRQAAIRLEEQGRVSEAVKFYIQAARSGSCEAAVRLGEIYDQGLGGVRRDYPESIKWYNAARVLGCDVPIPNARASQSAALPVAFTLEGRTSAEARSWVSGYAWALAQSGVICVEGAKSPDSAPLLRALNEKFKSQWISAEQAVPVLWTAAVGSYPCGK